jgi:hypothetical protein
VLKRCVVGVSGVEPLCWSATKELISKMDLTEIGCEDGRWIELAQDCEQRLIKNLRF